MTAHCAANSALVTWTGWWPRRFYCVALTDQLVHQRIAMDTYQKYCGELETYVRSYTC